MTLKTRFKNTLEKLDINQNMIDEFWAVLEKNYTSSNRYYHNFSHIQTMFESYDQHIDKFVNPTELELAIFYHDVIYKSTKKNNELKSADLAVEHLQEFIDLESSNRIHDLIMVTKGHSCNENPDSKWMIDFDLKILGSDWETYWLYAQQIRKEYKIYPNILYNTGRKKALQHFLEQPIFQTEIFRNQYEDKAKQNTKREIELL